MTRSRSRGRCAGRIGGDSVEGVPLSSSSRLPLLPIAVASILAVILLIVPAPGSVSVVGTRALSAFGTGIPNVDLVSEVGLVLLAGATLASIVYAWRRHPERRVPVVAGAVGVVVAYGTSELAKLVFVQPRPCTRWPSASHCPPAGDWSLPSSHATLAFGAAIVIAVAVGRTWVAAAALVVAASVAIGRVLQGVHYVHDVAFGAVVGMAATLAVIGLARAWQSRRSPGRV